MSDPFSLLPLAVAAHGGFVDDFEIQQLVAAGLTLLQRSAPVARALSGKRSAILLPTTPQFFVALAASEGRGAVLINPLASPYEIAYQIVDANVGAVFTDAALAEKLPAEVARVLLDDAPRKATVLVQGVARDVDLGSHLGLLLEGEQDAAGSDEEAAIVYTSAMEGLPLGAMLSHRNLLANARATGDACGNGSGDTVLALLPFAHLFGLTATAVAPLLAGARVVTMARFSPGKAADLLASGDVTEIVGVPTVFRALLGAMERAGLRRLGGLRLCVCGGAPLDVALQDRWADATGVELRQGYGLTEAGPVCLFNRADRPNARGALGVALPGVEVRTADGEICIRGHNVFRGYVSRGEAGLRVEHGWLHTGDRGTIGSDGNVAFDGVLKSMFTRNGFNIYPREIERAVMELPGVENARVTQGADTDGDPEIELEVRGGASEDVIRGWCAARLSAYKQPGSIRFI